MVLADDNLDTRSITRAAQVWGHVGVGLNADPPNAARVVSEIRTGPRPYFNDRPFEAAEQIPLPIGKQGIVSLRHLVHGPSKPSFRKPYRHRTSRQ